VNRLAYKLIELFSGTAVMAKAFRNAGFDTTTLDNDPVFEPDICVDLLEFDYTAWEPNTVNVLWASPPCTTYSLAAIGKHREPTSRRPKREFGEISDRLVMRTIDIIKYMNPPYWFVENPMGGLRKMPFMAQLGKPKTIWYCRYGDIRAKPTDIWGVFPRNFPVMKCHNGNTECHHEVAPRGAKSGTQGLKNSVERAKIPRGFCELLAYHTREELDKGRVDLDTYRVGEQ